MGPDKKSFRDELEQMAQVSEIIDNIESFKGEKINIEIKLKEDKFKKIINNFREIDRKRDKFTISISNTNFIFYLEK